MSIIKSWEFLKAARGAAAAIGRALGKIDRAALLDALRLIVQFEPKDVDGYEKWQAVADAFAAAHPQYARYIDVIADVADAVVLLMKVIGAFASRRTVNAS